MRIRRPIIIPAILALGVAGSILSSSAMASAAVHTQTVHAHAGHATGGPYILYHT
jgi:hypothetical protein